MGIERHTARDSWPVFEILKSFSLNGSLHGFVYLFTKRTHRTKQYWMIAICFTFVICIYNLVLTGYEHLVTLPTVTSLNYKPRVSAKLPAVILCANMFSHEKYTKNIIEQNQSAALNTFIGYMRYSSMYSQVRKTISESVAETFARYPRLEDSFRLLRQNFETEFGVRESKFCYVVLQSIPIDNFRPDPVISV